MPCPARGDVRRAARFRAHASHRDLFSRAFFPGFAVLTSRSVLQAEEAVANLHNLPLRVAVRLHCGYQV
jgi:hypothetical protein